MPYNKVGNTTTIQDTADTRERTKKMSYWIGFLRQDHRVKSKAIRDMNGKKKLGACRMSSS
jgi:hypothetical protein